MICTEDYQGSQNKILHSCVIPGDSRQKEKKTAKTRSKVKSSDEDGSPKSAQKKVKLLQPYVMHLLSILCLPFKFKCNHLISLYNHIFIIARNTFPFSSEGNSTALPPTLGMCTHLMCWTCRWTQTNPPTVCAIRCLMAR